MQCVPTWFLVQTELSLACSRLSVSEDDRKSERVTSGISTLTEILEQAKLSF